MSLSEVIALLPPDLANELVKNGKLDNVDLDSRKGVDLVWHQKWDYDKNNRFAQMDDVQILSPMTSSTPNFKLAGRATQGLGRLLNEAAKQRETAIKNPPRDPEPRTASTKRRPVNVLGLMQRDRDNQGRGRPKGL